MSEVATAEPSASAVRLPPAIRAPRMLQGMGFAMSRRWMIGRLSRRYGSAALNVTTSTEYAAGRPRWAITSPPMAGPATSVV